MYIVTKVGQHSVAQLVVRRLGVHDAVSLRPGHAKDFKKMY